LTYFCVSRQGDVGEDYEGWNRTVETPSNQTSFTIGDLSPFTMYFFKISARNDLGYSKPSLASYPTITHRERKLLSKTFFSKILFNTQNFLQA